MVARRRTLQWLSGALVVLSLVSAVVALLFASGILLTLARGAFPPESEQAAA